MGVGAGTVGLDSKPCAVRAVLRARTKANLANIIFLLTFE
jgi:hypothetical protein